jgi:hypothetical protein
VWAHYSKATNQAAKALTRLDCLKLNTTTTSSHCPGLSIFISCHFTTLITRYFKPFKMDTLVAQYSRPMFEQDYSQEDQLELYQQAPSLSLKFAMPPVAQVCTSTLDSMLLGALQALKLIPMS